MQRLFTLLLIVVTSVLGTSSSAYAEGTNELGTTQALTTATVVYATIVDSDNEVICWIGSGNVAIYEPGAPGDPGDQSRLR